METRQVKPLLKVLSISEIIKSLNDLMVHPDEGLIKIITMWETIADDPEQASVLRDELRSQLHACMKASKNAAEDEVYYQATLTLAYMNPINESDAVHQDVIAEENKVVTSDGYQHDIHTLRECLTRNTKNPWTRVPFSERDLETIIGCIKEKDPEAQVTFNNNQLVDANNHTFIPMSPDQLEPFDLAGSLAFFLMVTNADNLLSVIEGLQRIWLHLPQSNHFSLGIATIGAFIALYRRYQATDDENRPRPNHETENEQLQRQSASFLSAGFFARRVETTPGTGVAVSENHNSLFM